jgi:hypothetical protein
VNAVAGRGLAAIGVVLAAIAIWLDNFDGGSKYWDDGTTGIFLLILCLIAALAIGGGQMGQETNGWAFAAGAILLGFYGFYPAVLAFDDWDLLAIGAWLGLAGAALIVIGTGAAYAVVGGAPSTPGGTSTPALAAGLGIVLIFPAIFIDASEGDSYWSISGHSLGILLLVLSIAAALLWAASVAGTPTRGLDQAVTLVLLGLLCVGPVVAAFGDFGSLDAGAWLGIAGAILAAGGTWAARGVEMPRTAASPA